MVRAAWMVALAAAIWAGPGAAWADDPTTGTGSAPEGERQPPPEAPPPPPPPAHAQAPEVEVVQPARSRRPEAFAIGIGIGYDFPAGLDRPDVVSVRFRLPRGLTLEPTLRLEGAGRTTSIKQPGPNPDDASDSFYGVTVGSNVRLPLKGRGPLDLLGVAGAALTWSSEDPAGDGNNTKQFVVDVSWGLSIDWWLSEHWTFGLTATNPLFVYNTTTQDTSADASKTTTTTGFGLIFDPNVVLTAHLFF